MDEMGKDRSPICAVLWLGEIHQRTNWPFTSQSWMVVKDGEARFSRFQRANSWSRVRFCSSPLSVAFDGMNVNRLSPSVYVCTAVPQTKKMWKSKKKKKKRRHENNRIMQKPALNPGDKKKRKANDVFNEIWSKAFIVWHLFLQSMISVGAQWISDVISFLLLLIKA